jgi:hypothetical protein
VNSLKARCYAASGYYGVRPQCKAGLISPSSQERRQAFQQADDVLEEIDRAFRDANPEADEIIEFIEDAGGVAGLYDLSRIGNTNGNSQSPSESPNIIDLKPNEIALPLLGARVTKVGRGYQLRLIERQPGDYIVRLRVGRGGFVQAILDEDISHDNAA